jgi:hypothetical protein
MSVIPSGHAHGDADRLAHLVNEIYLYRAPLTRIAFIGDGAATAGRTRAGHLVEGLTEHGRKSRQIR